jgi:uncharacterized protein (DUF2141 family)
MKRFTLAAAFIAFASMILVLSSCKKEEDNNNPVINSVTVDPASVEAGAMAMVTVAATDPDGDALTYTYTVSGGAIAPNGSTANWTAPAQAGAYSVSVTVSDGNGGTASSNGALTVVAPPTQIVGTASFPAGTSGDLSNSKVSIYTSYENWLANQPIEFGSVTGSGASVSFTLANINPGNYYLDVWKDNDNDAGWSTGDFLGWYGSGGLGSPNLTEIQISEGQTVNVNISMFIVEGASTSVSGTATLTGGTVGDLSGAMVGLYLTINDFLAMNPYASTTAIGDGTSVDYEFAGIEAGFYYLGIWKDTDNNLQLNEGDFLGWHGTGTPLDPVPVQIEVVSGEALQADMTVFLIAGGPAATTITGTATIVDGTGGDLVNSVAYLYTSIDNWASYISEYSVNTTGSGESVSFAFVDIVPGTYLLDVWKDADNSGDWSPNDYVGVYGDIFNTILFEITIAAGEVQDFEVDMYLLGEKKSENITDPDKRLILPAKK